jgi:hypothetical protein
VSDNGAKAPKRWWLTVELIGGLNLGSEDSNFFVVVSCNEKSFSSSIKFQDANPEWNGIVFFFS